MVNPIIKLTGTTGRTIRINVNHIVTYDQREYDYRKDNDPTHYTYNVLNGGNAITRSVTETPEEIDEIITMVSLAAIAANRRR